jgi:predicted dienelactone hydrolase
MRPWEWITVVLLSVGWIALVIPAKKPRSLLDRLPLLPLAAAAAQWVFERYRWSMVPAYFLSILFFLIGVLKIWNRASGQPAGRGGRVIKGTAAIAALTAVAIAGALPALFPVFTLPSPTGPYAVGTTTFEWTDESRAEIFSPDPADRRDLLVQVWYPAEDVAGAKPVPLWPDSGTLGANVAKTFGMPSFLFDQLALVQSHARLDAPVAAADAAYPILVFSHAYTPGFAGQNTVQMEELASQGFAVFSVAHPYEAAAVTFADGRTVPYSADRYRSVIRDGTVKAIPILKACMAAEDPAEKERLFREYLAANSAAQESVTVWTEDSRFVLDQIGKLARGEISGALSGRLDTGRIGLFGHSMGGVISGETCMLDRRCKAVANLDGVQLGGLIDGSLEQPFLMMYSEINAGQNDWMFARGRNPQYRLVVRGTVHTDYSDFPLISPLFKAVGAAGSLDPYRIEEIVNRYLVAFFNQYLNGRESPLLDGSSSDFPEVDFQVR